MLFSYSNFSHAEEDYEFIVIGSGAGGGTLASGLAARGHTVLLLEAGVDTSFTPYYSVPILGATASEDADMSWNFHVDHYSNSAHAKRDSKLMCSNTAGELARCTNVSAGDCQCPTTHPYPKGIFYPRGSALGGSTAVNAMIYVQPKNSDWEKLETITGDSSWDAANMHQYYQQVAQKLSWGIADPQEVVNIQGAKVEAIIESSIDTVQPPNLPANATALDALGQDINQAALVNAEDGVWSTPTSIKLGQRNGSREMVLEAACLPDLAAIEQLTAAEVRARCEANGFINPATNQPYLTVKTGAFATRLLWAADPQRIPFTLTYTCTDDCRRAVGVEYIDQTNVYGADRYAVAEENKPRISVFASKEIIVSTGTYNTPQLLMLSGVGPFAELKKHGIYTRKNLKGVGRNLHDRYEVPIISETDAPFQAGASCVDADPTVNLCFGEWFTSRSTVGRATGYYSTNGLLFSVVTKSDPSQAEENLHILGGALEFRGYFNGYSATSQPGNLWTWLVLLAHTDNRGGVVTLNSSSPLVSPNIDYNYFEDGNYNTYTQGGAYNASGKDLNAMVNGIELVRSINQDVKNKNIVFNELSPGANYNTRSKLTDFVRNEAWGHHATGTAKIGSENDSYAVLNSNMQVYGTENLRVCDASIFPHIPGTFIASSIYTACEKLADVIAMQYAD